MAAGITFDQIMSLRAKAMAERGMKPDNPVQKQTGSNKQPAAPVGAIQRRMVPQEAPTPAQYLRKLPPEIAALAVQYGRI